jgi:hypothetical protein
MPAPWHIAFGAARGAQRTTRVNPRRSWARLRSSRWKPAPAIGLEPITCRLTEGLSWAWGGSALVVLQPRHLHKGLSEACSGILAVVPTYTGECRFVRVSRVLDAFPHRTCVGFVLAQRRWTARSAAALTAPSRQRQACRVGSSSSCRAAAGQFASAWLCVAGIEQTTHWLACHLGDQLVVAVDVQYLGTVQFGGRGDDQVRDRAPVTIAAILGK